MDNEKYCVTTKYRHKFSEEIVSLGYHEVSVFQGVKRVKYLSLINTIIIIV